MQIKLNIMHMNSFRPNCNKCYERIMDEHYWIMKTTWLSTDDTIPFTRLVTRSLVLSDVDRSCLDLAGDGCLTDLACTVCVGLSHALGGLSHAPGVLSHAPGGNRPHLRTPTDLYICLEKCSRYLWGGLCALHVCLVLWIFYFKSLYRVACSVRDWSSTGPCAIKYRVKSDKGHTYNKIKLYKN